MATRIMQTNIEGGRVTVVVEGAIEDFNGFGLDRASYDAIDSLTTPGMTARVTEGDVTAVFTRLVDGEGDVQQWELADTLAPSAPAPLVFRWTADPDMTDAYLDDDADKAYLREHGAMECTLYRPCPEHGVDCKHAEVLASLCGIVESQDPTERADYRREVEAQLLAEVNTTPEETGR